jgi:hypothetical protein
MVADSAASGLRAAALAVVLALTFATLRTADAQQPDRQSIGTFSIDRTGSPSVPLLLSPTPQAW